MNILVVDDHALIREGMVGMIRSLAPEARVEQADRCDSALEMARRGHFDLMLLDLQLPDRPGFVALEHCRTEHPETAVVVVSGQEDRETVLRALDLGAKSFIPKSTDVARLREALAVVLAGGVYLPESVGAPGAAAPIPWPLTPRQVEVLALVVAGLPNKLIARRLDIAESTVKIHVSVILRELKVTSRTQALIAVAKAGVRL
jgi:DNA-binding NarL/FixJ family response regulator